MQGIREQRFLFDIQNMLEMFDCALATYIVVEVVSVGRDTSRYQFDQGALAIWTCDYW